VWVDARKLRDAWDDLKRGGPPLTDQNVFSKREQMMAVLNEVLLGSKFDDRAPDEKILWGRVKRSNVLGQVDKLAKAVGKEFQADYQWLCNTVHPSLGNTFAFSAPPMVHETRTHMITWFAGRSIHIQSADGAVKAERTVQTATARASTTALKVLTNTLDAALRVADDVGLTTGAPALSRDSYWRNVRLPERNDPCPCRSGRKGKRCRHVWGDMAPGIPDRFELARQLFPADTPQRSEPPE
jgi:hypothetical protein